MFHCAEAPKMAPAVRNWEHEHEHKYEKNICPVKNSSIQQIVKGFPGFKM